MKRDIEKEELVDFMRKIEYCIQLCIVLSYVKNFYMYCILIKSYCIEILYLKEKV